MSLLHSEPTDPPVKRKRGRPAKLNKEDGNYPSFTMQFRAFPESTSPSAEMNSNMIMQMGEPDTFTPLMKVSPANSRKKARKNSLVSTSTSDSPFWDNLATLANSHNQKPYMGLTPATINKLSLITSDEISPPAYLNSPPNSALKPSLRMSPDLKESRYNASRESRFSEKRSRILKSSPLQNKPDYFQKEKHESQKRSPQNISFIEDDLFSFKLTVDDGGRAALASKYDDHEQVSARTTIDSDSDRLRSSIVSLSADSCMSMDTGSFLGTSASSMSEGGFDQAPGDKFIVPQTPTQKDCATPRMESILENYNMAFNLTPQFNSMMYSMMNINSPLNKSSSSPSVRYLHSPQHFAGSQEEHRTRKSEQVETAINTADLVDMGGAGIGIDYGVDEGDARSALKRAFKKF